MENVDAILHKGHIRDFQRWISTLAQLGYTSSYALLNAKDFGIAQNRNRCFMVSCLDGTYFQFPNPPMTPTKLSDFTLDSVPSEHYLSQDTIKRHIINSKKKADRNLCFKFEPVTGDCTAVPTFTTRYGHRITDCYLDTGDGIRRLTTLEVWRLMGFSDDDYYAVNRAAVSKTQMNKQAGNSIVVNVPMAIFDAVYNSEKKVKQRSLMDYHPTEWSQRGVSECL